MRPCRTCYLEKKRLKWNASIAQLLEVIDATWSNILQRKKTVEMECEDRSAARGDGRDLVVDVTK
jgi:hypothetical protein